MQGKFGGDGEVPLCAGEWGLKDKKDCQVGKVSGLGNSILFVTA